MLAAVEWGKVLQIVWVSLLIGVAVTALYSVAIYGGSRAAEARRTGQGSGTAFAALAGLALVAFAGIVVFAITVILNKS